MIACELLIIWLIFVLGHPVFLTSKLAVLNPKIVIFAYNHFKEMTKIGINQEQDKHCGNQQQVVNIESLMGTLNFRIV